jgi:hypothetical protein
LGNTLGTETLPSKGIQLLPDYKKCSTPWGYEVNHGESVLAYEQDLNTPDTCKIQRRFCFDGKFSGTFSQQSCSVNTKYSYFQEQFVSYNIPNQNSELIQPSPPPTFTAENVGNGATQEGIDEILKTPNL